MKRVHKASVDVCVCTFRRAQLVETLQSILVNADDEIGLRVIVADNDVTPSAQHLTETFAAQAAFPVIYLHVPAANISLARNACLDAASADFIAFVDDDEYVAANWLKELLLVADQTGADAVLGPVVASYNPEFPEWLRSGDFHSTLPVRVGGVIQTGYTCNVLMRRKQPFVALRFDLALGRSGGEDTDYFYRLHELGGNITFAPLALVYEPVAPERARLSWLLRRRFRSGQTYGARLARISTNRWGILAPPLAKICYCLVMAAMSARSPVGWRHHLLRGALHIGVIAGMSGSQQARLYGDVSTPTAHLNSEKN